MIFSDRFSFLKTSARSSPVVFSYVLGVCASGRGGPVSGGGQPCPMRVCIATQWQVIGIRVMVCMSCQLSCDGVLTLMHSSHILDFKHHIWMPKQCRTNLNSIWTPILNFFSIGYVLTDFLLIYLKLNSLFLKPPRATLTNRITLTLNRTQIFESTKIRYLGVILDNKLTWKYHIFELGKKINRAVWML